MEATTQEWVQVGAIVRPADGSSYRGRIIEASRERDVVRHQDLKTGQIYEKSWFGFFCRYCLEGDEVACSACLTDLPGQPCENCGGSGWL